MPGGGVDADPPGFMYILVPLLALPEEYKDEFDTPIFAEANEFPGPFCIDVDDVYIDGGAPGAELWELCENVDPCL